jgi:flagellar protein FlaF
LQALAVKAYGEVQQRTVGDKEIEYALFRQITEALEAVAETTEFAPAAWADAVHRNQQLWTIIAADLLSPGNALPDDLKQSLLYLSEFVRRTSLNVLAGEDGLRDLIEVNRTVMAGLPRSAFDNVARETS